MKVYLYEDKNEGFYALPRKLDEQELECLSEDYGFQYLCTFDGGNTIAQRLAYFEKTGSAVIHTCELIKFIHAAEVIGIHIDWSQTEELLTVKDWKDDSPITYGYFLKKLSK